MYAWLVATMYSGTMLKGDALNTRRPTPVAEILFDTAAVVAEHWSDPPALTTQLERVLARPPREWANLTMQAVPPGERLSTDAHDTYQDSPRLGVHLQFRVLIRDRFRCRYCLMPVVPFPILGCLSRVITRVSSRASLFPLHPHGMGRSKALELLDPSKTSPSAALTWLEVDHVRPKRRAGALYHEQNLVSSCPLCNADKGDWLPVECGLNLLEPKPLRYAGGRQWHGLTEFYAPLEDIRRQLGLKPSIDAWRIAAEGDWIPAEPALERGLADHRFTRYR